MALLKSVITGQETRNSHAHVVGVLGREIVDGTYPVGSTLPGDQDLAERFHVSRTVLRETMKTLAAKGMIVARARVGTRVTPREKWNLFDSDVLSWFFQTGVDQQFLDHLCDMRLSFEPFAAGLAAQNASDDEITEMQLHVEGMRNATNTQDFAIADLEFHLVVLRASRNPFMYSVGNLIEAGLASAFTLSSPAEQPESHSLSVDAHGEIAEAIAARNAELAAEKMRVVIVDGKDRVAAKMDGKARIATD
ncbi:FadR/GntR family transcriptional regulator [Qingshengfaniella alkalisoli]|uniref:FadR family transcriptional regulator n=1 Tax=Qingshengfaniella alkalisoli TaxID=2599296 RepID=A0A5B8IXK0_9RHOB|nr:FadR/GntR family transcriptional regulator [Qingshengfaniella alkalisoli]QDY70882.1 FadR family transcriptional regulator [Qingshengfaniella alkalisoli]